MKNLKIISTILLSSILLGATNITNAYTYKNNNSSLIQNFKDYKEKQYLKQKYREMEKMSIEELQNIIHNAKINSENRNYIGDGIKGSLKIAWFAAAEIAKRNGYPLSAKLITNSLLGFSYGETNGMFAEEIKKTSLYKNVLIKNQIGDSEFTKDMHPDLFYSIHKFDYINKKSELIIRDTFNFEESNGRFSFFTGLINDWGFLNQNLGVLNPINVDIFIKK